MTKEKEELIHKIVAFIRNIGLKLEFQTGIAGSVLPGIMLDNGTLLVDPERLTYPGDLLHEAGHLAPFPASVRNTMSGMLENNDLNMAGEIMAFAWSYAACVHLDINPEIVFHEGGYRGGSQNVIGNFEAGLGVGLPLMEWYGLTYTEETAVNQGKKPYPHMIRWVCEMET